MFSRLYATSTRAAIGAVVALVLLITTLITLPVVDGYVIVGAANIDAAIQHLAPLNIPELPEHSVLVDANGNPIATFYYQNRIDVSLNQVSPYVTSALLSAEDRSFFTNDGIDPRGILRALVNDLSGGPTQGGSTITQQYIKNLLELQTHTLAPDTITRKLHEIAYARQLTREMSKDQILDGYLNTVYFGESAYGIQAASLRYFSIPAASLSLDQAALLVALVRDPVGYDPLANPALALQARNRVLDMMVANHQLAPQDATIAQAQPIVLHESSLPANGCYSSPYPYFCEWVWNDLLSLPALGATTQDRVNALDTGGYVIHTTLNPHDQAAAQAAVTAKISTQDRVGTAIVSITPGTGAVTAMAQNRVWGINTAKNQTEVNYATSVSPVGSTFKAFTLATAMAQGISPNIILPAGSTYHSNIFDNPQPQNYFSNAEPYTASNISLTAATAGSVNTAFVQLEEKVGVLNIARMAYKMGLRSLPLTGPTAPTPREGSLTLGARSFSPLEMASAYATLASGGIYCAPVGVSAIVTRQGTTIPVDPSCSRAVPQSVAAQVTSLLDNVVTYGTGTAAYVPHQVIAGKTGTTQNFGSAWFIGYTPTLVTASWMGDPRGPKYPLYNVGGVSAVYGGTLPAEEFAIAMNTDLNTLDLPSQPLDALSNPQVVVPNLEGVSGPLALRRLTQLGLRVSSALPPVVGSELPAAGTLVPPGSYVTLGASSS